MPNWCEGIMKLRGNKENLLKFALEELIRVERKSFFEINHKKLFGEDFDYTDYQLYVDNEKQDIWFKNSRRMFITQNIDWWFDNAFNVREEENYIQCLDIKQAWDIDVDDLLKIAQEYNLDIKVIAFESGMQFHREILIENGKLEKNITKQYDNTKEYEWEVYDPRLGG